MSRVRKKSLLLRIISTPLLFHYPEIIRCTPKLSLPATSRPALFWTHKLWLPRRSVIGRDPARCCLSRRNSTRHVFIHALKGEEVTGGILDSNRNPQESKQTIPGINPTAESVIQRLITPEGTCALSPGEASSGFSQTLAGSGASKVSECNLDNLTGRSWLLA